LSLQGVIPLVWKDLSEKQVVHLLARSLPGANREASQCATEVRGLLAEHFGLTGHLEDKRQAIKLDLFFTTFQYAAGAGFSPTQISSLMSIVKETHEESMAKILIVEKSFQVFRAYMLQHSVHRPPSSVGVFTEYEAQKVIDWAIGAYFRQYKLYQYVYTFGRTCNVTSRRPEDGLFEVPHTTEALGEATPWEEHQKALSDAEEQRQEEERLAAEAAAAEAEAQRLKDLNDAYDASIPEDVRIKVQEALAKELEKMRVEVEGDFNTRQNVLQDRITRLEAKVGGKK